tara:strand:- start:251 stop:418 length:168 start_codon:yes stop_codon:yes gene_type:complete
MKGRYNGYAKQLPVNIRYLKVGLSCIFLLRHVEIGHKKSNLLKLLFYYLFLRFFA